MYEGDVTLLEEIDELEYFKYGGSIIVPTPLSPTCGVSAYLGNDGQFCTVTVECQPNCN